MKYLTDLINECGYSEKCRVPNEKYVNFLNNLKTMISLKPESFTGVNASRAELVFIYHVLEYSAAQNGKNITVAEAARLLSVSKPAISRMVKNLTRKGYIERKTDLRDHRSVHIVVTKSGEDMLKHFLKSVCAVLDAALENFSDEELERMIELQGRFVNAVKGAIDI